MVHCWTTLQPSHHRTSVHKNLDSDWYIVEGGSQSHEWTAIPDSPARARGPAKLSRKMTSLVVPAWHTIGPCLEVHTPPQGVGKTSDRNVFGKTEDPKETPRNLDVDITLLSLNICFIYYASNGCLFEIILHNLIRQEPGSSFPYLPTILPSRSSNRHSPSCLWPCFKSWATNGTFLWSDLNPLYRWGTHLSTWVKTSDQIERPGSFSQKHIQDTPMIHTKRIRMKKILVGDFLQPNWKIWSSNWIHLPQGFGGKIPKKNKKPRDTSLKTNECPLKGRTIPTAIFQNLKTASNILSRSPRPRHFKQQCCKGSCQSWTYVSWEMKITE